MHLPARLTRFLPLLPFLLLPPIGLAVYWNGLHGGFIFDDFGNLVDNPVWKLQSLGWHELLRPLASGFASDLGRPLAMLSFGINYYLTGMDPFWLKLTGLCLHIVNSALVYVLCVRLFALAPVADARARMGRYAAAMVAFAWLLHPLQVSTVLYVVQRMEVGACTFVLLSLLAYLRGRRAGVHWGWLALAALCALAGLGFKETALLAPGYALLVELCLLRFRKGDGTVSRPLAALYGVGVALALAVFALKFVPDALRPWAYAGRNFTLGQRLLTQMPVLAMYLGQILLPLPDTLRFYYDNFPVSTSLLSPPATLRGALILLGLLSLAFGLRHRYPLVALGIGWFFAGHALTSNVIPLELAFEHRNYFPLLGILIAAAQMLAWLARGLHMDARRTLAVLPVGLLAVLCVIQAHTWGNPLRLSMALATRGIDSPRASYDLGRTMLIASHYDAASPFFSLARKELEHASRLPNASPLADQALIMMDARTGRSIPDATWDAFRAKLQRRTEGPQERASLSALAQCRTRRECRFDDRQLVRSFQTALQRDPGNADLHMIYGFYAINALGDTPLAVDMGREAVRLAPETVQYRANLAKFLAVTGESPAELDRLVAQVRSANGTGRFDAELAEIEKLRTVRKSRGR